MTDPAPLPPSQRRIRIPGDTAEQRTEAIARARGIDPGERERRLEAIDDAERRFRPEPTAIEADRRRTAEVYHQ